MLDPQYHGVLSFLVDPVQDPERPSPG